jgi:hypothetical protein
VLNGSLSFYTIHGALDWLPAWLGQYYAGVANHFLPTMFIYDLLDAVAGLLFYLVIAAQLKSDARYISLVLLAVATLASYLVGYRDVFLLASLWIFFRLQRPFVSAIYSHLSVLILGVILAANVIWSFDRGFAGLAALGVACILGGLEDRRYLAVLGVFLCSMLILSVTGFWSITHHVENFRFLIATSSLWSLGYSEFDPAYLTLITILPNGVALYVLGRKLYGSWSENKLESANLLLLLVLTGIMFKIGINRADAFHVVMAFWMPILTYVYMTRNIASTSQPIATPLPVLILPLFAIVLYAGKYPLFILLAIPPIFYFLELKRSSLSTHALDHRALFLTLLIAVMLVKVIKVNSHSDRGEYSWLKGLANPPVNELLVEKEMRWIASELISAKSNCVFDLSNSGLINGVTGLPACTKYTYPAYATETYEADMKNQLQGRSPSVVIFSADPDYNNMQIRFPDLKQYLVDTYPFEKCNYGYCLRYLHQPS